MIGAGEAAVTYEKWQLDALGNAGQVVEDPICFSWVEQKHACLSGIATWYQELRGKATT
jgi:hypothetical protein